jgi:hypothetical protein
VASWIRRLAGKSREAMMTGREAAEQIQHAVDNAARALLAGHVEVPAQMLRMAETLARLTRVHDRRVVEAAIAGEFIEQLGRRLRGLDDAGTSERMRVLMIAVAETFPGITAVAADLLELRTLDDGQVRHILRQTPGGSKLLGEQVSHRRESPPPAPAYRALTYVRGSVMEADDGQLLAIRRDGHARHFRSLGDAYSWL